MYITVSVTVTGVILEYTDRIYPVFVLVSGCMITAGSILCAILCCPQPPTDGHGKSSEAMTKLSVDRTSL